MEALLAKKLIEKGAIRQDTEFEAFYFTHGLSCLASSRLLGRFHITAATYSKEKSQVIFEALSGDKRERYKFTNDQIISLDGMPPARLAAIYNLSARGDDVAVGRRRGRKPRQPPANGGATCDRSS